MFYSFKEVQFSSLKVFYRIFVSSATFSVSFCVMVASKYRIKKTHNLLIHFFFWIAWIALTVTLMKSWAPTMKKVSGNRHRHSPRNTRQPTSDKQEPTTDTDRGIRQSIEHLTTDPHPATKYNRRQIHPTTDTVKWNCKSSSVLTKFANFVTISNYSRNFRKHHLTT
jgi:hypothetical protein